MSANIVIQNEMKLIMTAIMAGAIVELARRGVI